MSTKERGRVLAGSAAPTSTEQQDNRAALRLLSRPLLEHLREQAARSPAAHRAELNRIAFLVQALLEAVPAQESR